MALDWGKRDERVDGRLFLVERSKKTPVPFSSKIEGIRQVVRNVRDTVTAPRTDIANLERSALEEALVARGHQRFRAHQIFQWIYRHGVTGFIDWASPTMSDVPRALREQLAAEFALTTPALVHRERSVDGTEKFLLRLADGQQIESVFIPDTPSMTFASRPRWAARWPARSV